MRKIYLLSKIARKWEEWNTFLQSNYGVEVVMVPWEHEDRNDLNAIKDLLLDNSDGKPVAVCDEWSVPVVPGTETPISLNEGLRSAEHLSKIQCYTLSPTNELQDEFFEARVSGTIVTTRGLIEADGWWDTRFVVDATGLTYSETSLSERNKISARTQSLSRMVNSILLKDDLLNLNFDAPQFSRPVDFSVSFEDWMLHNPLLLNDSAKETGLAGFCIQAVNRGNYFRTRQKYDGRNANYFMAALAGHPLVKKKTAAWEAKFAFHDAGHSLNWRPLPDRSISEEERQVLIASGMVDESMWLAAGEFLFVDSLVSSGNLSDTEAIEYESWAAYREMGWAGKQLSLDELRSLLFANMRFFVRGDLSAFEDLGVNVNGPAFRRYIDWFTAFSVQDWNWNARNSLYVRANLEKFERWWELIGPINDRWELELETLGSFTASLSGDRDDIVDDIFDYMFSGNLAPYYRKDIPLKAPVSNLNRAFSRWIVNQLAIVSEFWDVDSVRHHGRILADTVVNQTLFATVPDLLEEISVTREYFERCILDSLLQSGRISADDKRLYAEIFPMFPRFSISYEEPDETIESVAERYLGEFGSRSSIEDVAPGVTAIICNKERTFFLLEQKQDDHPIAACRQCYSLWGGSRDFPTEITEVALRRELSEELVDAPDFVDEVLRVGKRYATFRLPQNQYGEGEFECQILSAELDDNRFLDFSNRIIARNHDQTVRPEGHAKVVSRNKLERLLENTNNFVGSLDRVLKAFLSDRA